MVPADLGRMPKERAASLDQTDVEARAAHVGRDHVAIAERLGEIARAEHAAGRSAREHEHGTGGRLARVHDAAAAVEDAKRAAEPTVAQAGLESLDVGLHRGAEIGVQYRRRRALVLTDHRVDVRGEAEEEIFARELSNDLPD